MLGKKADRLMGEGIPAFSLRPHFLFYKQRISAFKGDEKQGIYMLCPQSLPGSLDGMSLLYFSNSVCL